MSEIFTELLTEVAPLAGSFAARGFRLFLVGGIVRDALLGRQRASLDIDLTTDALPDEIEALVRAAQPKALWLQGKRFGTVGATFAGRDGADRAYEITTHRAEAYSPDSRKPEVAFSSDIAADLSRRDFTVNAMAVDTRSVSGGLDSLVDPFGGSGDLRSRVLRTPVDPMVSFSDDPLRMLRAARFAAGYGFVPEAALVEAVVQLRDRLSIISAERIRDEFVKLLLLDRPGSGLAFLASTGLLPLFAPEVSGLDPAVMEARLRRVAPQEVMRLAVLFGSVDTSVSSVDVRLRALRCSMETVDNVRSLLRMRAEFAVPTTDEDVRRLLLLTGDLRSEFFALLRAFDEPGVEETVAWVDKVIAAEGASMNAELDGERVMAELSIGPSRQVGEALTMLREERLRRGPLGEEGAVSALRTWWSERSLQ